MIRKVQLPMARRSLLVATNQGIVLVLAMVVVGGLVGAGALGYDVVAGFSQSEDFGKGLAAAHRDRPARGSSSTGSPRGRAPRNGCRSASVPSGY